MKKYILKEKGITLISLIITIIIILILAGISLNMIKGDSSILNQAISAQDKTIKGALKEKNDLNNLSSEATSKIQEALPGYKAPNSSVSDSEPVVPEIKHENTVQDGGTYYVGVTDTTPGNYSNPAETYAPGQDFPETPSNGDIYIYGDYEYRYNMVYTYTRSWEWYSNEINGWSVRVIDNTKSAYGPILSEINGKKIVSLCGTFANCTSLKTAPSIPNNITNLRYTFYECDSLTTAPNIPNNVEYLTYTFAGCDSLTTVKSIPNSVKEIYQAFFGCQMLTGTITIDSTPTYYWACFENTKKELYLTGSSTILKELAATDKYEDYSENDNVRVLKNIAPIPDGAIYYRGVTSENPGDYTGATQIYTAGQKFPDNVIDGDVYVYGDYEYRFNQYFYIPTSTVSRWYSFNSNSWGVRVLDTTKEHYGTILPSINEYPITNMSSTFKGCNSMIESPKIPDTITNMQCAYTGCSALIKAPILPNGVVTITEAFSYCTSLKTTPEIPQSVDSMSYTFAGCTSLTTATTIPENVGSLNGTFRDCTSLSGLITINKSSIHASYAELNFCFWGTTKEIYLTGSSPYLHSLASQDTNNNVSVYSH